jgi:serine protease Do
MKQYFLKTIGAGSLAVILCSSALAQDVVPDKTEKPEKNEQIIIRKKGDKDVKITVEIKDGKTLINGKPAEDFKDADVTIQNIVSDGDNFAFMTPPHIESDHDNLAFITPDPPASPFRGGWSYSNDNVMNDSKTAFLGVTTESVEGGGVKILSISEESGAEKAKLLKGDIITKINDTEVNSPEKLSETIHKFKPEDKVTVTYKRDGKEQKVEAVLGKFRGMKFKSYNLDGMEGFGDMKSLRGLAAPRAYSYSYGGRPKLGIKAQDTEDGKGVKVIDVDDESPAEKAGIKEGDIITDFDSKPINSADDLVTASRASKDKLSFKIKLKRNDKAQEVEVKIPKKLKTADL